MGGQRGEQRDGAPNTPATLGLGLPGRINRYLTVADVDWFVLTLP